ncbi:MAG: hypothetical protein EOP49_02080 [Sphingobacteriales bacterium]|nr:MAG: hypothetical protein EOP49_02080 [Sphingobacteriales bacterium]
MIFRSPVFVCLSLLVLLFSSCVRDQCRDKACANGGICVMGNCSCLNGFEGPDCSEVWNKRFQGKWTISQSFQGQPEVLTEYDAPVFRDAKPDQFIILGFHNLFDTIICRRTSYYGFSFAVNQMMDSTAILLSGSGFIDSSGSLIQAEYNLLQQDTTIRYGTSWTPAD